MLTFKVLIIGYSHAKKTNIKVTITYFLEVPKKLHPSKSRYRISSFMLYKQAINVIHQ